MPHHPFFSRSISTLSAVLVILAISALINGGHVLMDSPYPPLIAHAAGGNECSDGEDNDSDGQIDFADFGCFGPNGQETMTDYGFTLFTPSADTRILYISSSEGSDTNDGLSPESPLRTLNVMRDDPHEGSPHPDWYLLKRGDTWDVGGAEAFHNYNGDPVRVWGPRISGRSESEPVLVGSYGTSTVRPRIIDGGIGFSNYSAVVGLNFVHRNQDTGIGSPLSVVSISWEPTPSLSWDLLHDVLMEDNLIEGGWYDGIEIQGASNVKVRNNISIDAHSIPNGRNQGAYFEKVKNLLIEGNVFDHNGWAEGVAGAEASIYNHNFYINSGNRNPVIVRNNIITRGSSHGLQLRSGGLIEDNLFVDNAIGAFNAGGDASLAQAQTVNNVFVGGRDINGDPRNMDLEIIVQDVDQFVQGNIFTHQDCSGGTYGFAMGLNSLIQNAGRRVTISNNKVSDICGGPGILIIEGFNAQGNTVTISKNSFSHLVPQRHTVMSTHSIFSNSGINFNGNFYDNGLALDAKDGNTGSSWFNQYGGTPVYLSATDWPSISGESDAVFGPISFPDPSRSIETYMSSLGKSASKSAFYSEIRKQSKFNWRPEYTAHAINEYFRAGYGLPSVPSTYQTQAPIKTQAVTPASCTSFTYSAWSTCGSNNKQTRTVQSSSPTNCTGGSPVLSQSCTYTAPVSTPVTCTSFTYSEWSSCKKSSNTKTRTVLSSLPANCTGGSPVTSQSCTYTPTVPKASAPVSAPTTNPLSTYTAPSFVPTQVQSTPSEASNPAAEIQSTPSFLPAREALPEPLTDIECTDGLDNDYDGLIDYPADPDCLSDIDDHEILDLWEAFKRMLRSIGRFLKELVS